MGKVLRKGNLPEAIVLLERDIKDLAEITLMETVPEPSSDYWHPPVCQNYKPESGCKFGERWKFRHKEVDSQPNKKPKKNAGKVSVASLKNSTQLGCVLQDVGLLQKLRIDGLS